MTKQTTNCMDFRLLFPCPYVHHDVHHLRTHVHRQLCRCHCGGNPPSKYLRYPSYVVQWSCSMQDQHHNAGLGSIFLALWVNALRCQITTGACFEFFIKRLASVPTKHFICGTIQNYGRTRQLLEVWVTAFVSGDEHPREILSPDVLAFIKASRISPWV